MTPAVAIVEETLNRLNPQLPGADVLAVRIVEALDEEGLLWCEDEFDFGRPTVTVDVTVGVL